MCIQDQEWIILIVYCSGSEIASEQHSKGRRKTSLGVFLGLNSYANIVNFLTHPIVAIIVI